MFFAVNVLAPLMNRDDRHGQEPSSDQPSQPERRRNDGAASRETVFVRLVRKYAEMIDGVSLAHTSVGDQLELTRREANILIAEGWAVHAEERRGRTLAQRSLAADRSAGSQNRQKPKS